MSQGNLQRLKRSIFAFGHDLDIPAPQIAAETDETKVPSALDHEVAESYPLDATLDYGVESFVV